MFRFMTTKVLETQKKKQKKLLTKRLSIAIGLLFLLDLLVTLFFHIYISCYSFPKTTSSDVAIVFFHNWGPKKGLSQESWRRLQTAKNLYQNKKVTYVLCVGGARPHRHQSGSQTMRKILLREGLPEDKVHADQESFDTLSNCQETWKMIGSKSWKSATLVSSPWHLYRILIIMEYSRQDHAAKIFATPYNLNKISTIQCTYLAWQSIHHEAIAWFLWLTLPESTYRDLVNYRSEKASKI